MEVEVKDGVVVDTTKVDIFKQITTLCKDDNVGWQVVVDTTKVDIFKQITTIMMDVYIY